MTKLSLAGSFLIMLVYIASCTKDQADRPGDIDCSTVNQSENTYNLKIKGILDANCAIPGCHTSFLANSGVNLEDYTAAKTAFESQRALCSLKQEQGCSPMPSGSPKLADSLITYIQCWTENNYPQ